MPHLSPFQPYADLALKPFFRPVRPAPAPASLHALFPSESRCAEALFAARWPDGFRCPVCHHRKACVIRTRRLPLYECRACRRQTSVTSGTVMERSRTPLTVWFKAIFLLSQPSGISAKRLAALIGVTYKTAWHIAHKIRRAMQRDEEGKLLRGLVKIKSIHYGYELGYDDARHPLWLAASVEQGRIVEIRCKQPAPEHVTPDRYITEAGWRAFLANHVDAEATVTPMKELKMSKDRMALPIARIGWEIGRWLSETFRGIGAKHLQAYVDEYCFRVNVQNRGEAVMERLLGWCVKTRALTYRELTRDRPMLIVPWKLKGIPKNRWQGLHMKMWDT